MRNLFAEVDSIIFDNDGTLFQADLVSFPAIVSACKDLMKIHDIKLPIPSKDEINSHIGLPSSEFFKQLLPTSYNQYLDEFEQLATQHEINNIKKGLGSLYPGVTETLTELKKLNYSLGVITNAGVDYFNAVVEAFHYNQFFDAYLCLGDRKHLSKSDLLKELLDHFKSKKAAVVGDTKSDLQAAKKHKCLTITALYGYGKSDEIESAHEKISDFTQILGLFGNR